jgi:hypothetical protein
MSFMSGVYLAWQQLQPHVASGYNQLTKTALTVVSYKSIFDWVWFFKSEKILPIVNL